MVFDGLFEHADELRHARTSQCEQRISPAMTRAHSSLSNPRFHQCRAPDEVLKDLAIGIGSSLDLVENQAFDNTAFELIFPPPFCANSKSDDVVPMMANRECEFIEFR